MTKRTGKFLARALTLVSAIAGSGTTVLSLAGIVPSPVAAAVWIVAFPVLVLGLYLSWMAREGEPDIPFVGY